MNIKSTLMLALICAFFTVSSAHAATTTNLSANPGFEDSSVPYGSFQYADATGFWAANWIFSNGTGISNHNASWPIEGQINTVAFIQNTSTTTSYHPTVSQVITSSASSFNISFDIAKRSMLDQGVVEVYFDNKLIATLTPTNTYFSTTPQEFTNVPGLPTEIHTLTFRGVSTAADATVFIDNVSIEGVFP